MGGVLGEGAPKEGLVRLDEAFNRSRFSHFINSPAGRVFRVAAGTAFLLVGTLSRDHPLGVASMVWSVFPLSAGAFDVCFISAVLGGPLSGAKIRAAYGPSPTA